MHRAGRWERLRSWLIYGRPTGATSVCAEGHEWSAASYSVLRLRTYGYRRARLPWTLFRAVLHRRRVMPVPIIYLLAAVVGVVVGIGLDYWLGWRWWLVAPSLVGVVWLLYLSTALWGPYRIRLDDLLEVIDWEKAEARRHRRLEGAVKEGRRVAYGVDGWAGSVALSAWGHAPSDGLTLDHGDRDGEVWIAVTTRTGDSIPGEVRKTQAFFELAAEEHRPREELGIESMMRRQAEMDRRFREQAPLWVSATIRVDGIATPCQSVVRGNLWAAVLEVGETMIEVEARGGDPASMPLRRVESLEPYFEGLRARRQKPRSD